MTIEYHWAMPIAYENIYEVDNTKIKKFCYNLKKNSSGVVFSNAGGWQSNSLVLQDLEQNTETKKLISQILKKVNEFKTCIGIKNNLEFVLLNAWVNINEFGDFNRPHLHNYSAFSGVYYVDVDTEKIGDIYFTNYNQLVKHYWEFDWFVKEGPRQTCHGADIRFTPTPHKLLIFPSWVTHYVETNRSKKPRISIAFNFTPKY